MHPYRFAGTKVKVRLAGRTVEIFVKGERIAVRIRGRGNGKHTTPADHMLSSYRRYADWIIGGNRCALRNSFWSAGRIPSKASDPAWHPALVTSI